jgi:ribosome assembly protein YihI (activator of Der GTPase)
MSSDSSSSILDVHKLLNKANIKNPNKLEAMENKYTHNVAPKQVDTITSVLNDLEDIKSTSSKSSSSSSKKSTSTSTSTSTSSNSSSTASSTSSKKKKSSSKPPPLIAFTEPKKLHKSSQWNKDHAMPSLSSTKPKKLSDSDHINNILDSLDNNTSNSSGDDMITKFKESNWRIATITNINALRDSIEEDIGSKSLDSIPTVDYESEDKVIQNVYETLKYMDERHSNFTIATTVVDLAGTGLGEFFDGNKNVFGIKPDLTNINYTFVKKLKKVEFQTTEAVEHLMAQYGVTSGWKILFDLLSSIFAQHKSNVTMKAIKGDNVNKQIMMTAYNNIDNI